jgi:hypothetical protein
MAFAGAIFSSCCAQTTVFVSHLAKQPQPLSTLLPLPPDWANDRAVICDAATIGLGNADNALAAMAESRVLHMRRIIFMIPFMVIGLFLALKWHGNGIYTALIQEDTWIENAQFVLYLTASICCSLAVRLYLKQGNIVHGSVHAIFSVALLLIGLEEISWGQRIFDLPTPEYFKTHNFQGELTFHNLGRIQALLHFGYIAVGVWGTFSWMLPAPAKSSQAEYLRKVCSPPWFISSYFLPVFFIYTLLEFFEKPSEGSFLVWRDQEPAELLLAAGCAVFAVTLWRNVKSAALVSVPKSLL